jgi:glycosyltransferase involved in cell wall biosynthesis
MKSETNSPYDEPTQGGLELSPVEGRGFASDTFPEGIVRPISFETPHRLTDVISWHGHIPFAFWMVDALRPRVLVELGTHKGDSYCAFVQAVDRLGTGTACHAVDTWRGDQHAGFYGEPIFQELRQYHDRRYGHFSSLLRSTFDDAVNHFPDGSIDLLHIDGLHTYDAVKHDFETWLPKLSERAVVLLHDVDVRDSDFEVWRLWNELTSRFQSFRFHHSHGLGILAVGDDIAGPIRRLTEYAQPEAEKVRFFFSRLGDHLSRNVPRARLLEAQAQLRQQARDFALRRAEVTREIALLRAEVLTARQLLFEETHTLWNSSSWRLYRPFRNAIRRARGIGDEVEPTPGNSTEALQTMVAIRQSLSWEATSPIRIVHRILTREWKSRRAVVEKRLFDRARQSFANKSPSIAATGLWKELLAEGAWLPWRNASDEQSGKPVIVFASHEATRTGAPLILLSLVRHFARSGNYELFVFCDRPGPLLDAFAEHAHVIDRSRHDVFELSPTIVELLAAFGSRPLLAYCNTSVVNRYAIEFKRFGLPVITLVHEIAGRYAESEFREIYAASDRVVFPAEFARKAAHRQAVLPTGKALVIPQGLLDENFATGDRDEARRAVLKELQLPENTFLVLGCGTIDLRKGIDLFVDLAEKVAGSSDGAGIHFAWLGTGYGEASLWLQSDIAARGLANRVHLLGERDAPAPFFMAANVFVLPSREDPFPCVVQEAMVSETPVIAFAEAGGAPEALEGGCGVVVPYGDIDSMADAVLGLFRDPEAAGRMAKLAKQRVSTKYRFEDYYRALVHVAHDELGVPLTGDELKPAKLASKIGSECEKNDFLLIRNDASFDPDFYLPPASPRLSRDDAIRQFMHEYATAGSGRKPYSGFNPQTYAEQAMQPRDLETRNPLAHFIEQGKPPGPWLIPLIRASAEPPKATRLRTALHVHAFYPELMEELLQCLAGNLSGCDLFISTCRDEDLSQLKTVLGSYDRGKVEFCVVPNRGRDIGPFLTQYQWPNTSYDLIGHLHCKKTAHLNAEVGETWRHFLWWNLIGNRLPMMDLIASHFEADERLGLVFPDDPHVVGWWNNKKAAEALTKKMGILEDLPQAFEFPVGTMFWCRPLALRPLFELGLTWEDYPAEPLPNDGTILHALERLLPLVAQNEGYRVAATNVPGVTR